MSMSALSHILAVEYSYAVRTEIFSFPFLGNISLTLSFVLPCNYWTSPFMILSDSWTFFMLSKLSVIFFNDIVVPLFYLHPPVEPTLCQQHRCRQGQLACAHFGAPEFLLMLLSLPRILFLHHAAQALL